MNKDLINQLPDDEKPVAEKLTSAAEMMKLSQNFQWELENQLMDTYKSKTTGRQPGSFMNILAPVGWGIAAICGVLLLSWILRSLLPGIQAASGATPTQEISFEASVRQGNICTGPLAVEHGFAVFLTNQDKTGFVMLDAEKAIGELRSFTWSADGRQLAILGNTTGSGNIYLTDSTGNGLRSVLSNSQVGYLMDFAWSRAGKRFVMWSTQNNKTLLVMNADGTELVERQLQAQILGTPQFSPDDQSVVFYGATSTSAGLFEVMLADSQATQINSSVEDESGFAFSPDGSHLAYMENDRDTGEARLVSEDLTTRELAVLGTLPIPKGSGSSIPETANLSWSADGKILVFDFGRGASDRAVYLAYADGTGLVKVVDSAHAPSISSDGKCLAYVSTKQVFLLDMNTVFLKSIPAAPILLGDLPTGRGIAGYQLDKVQWKP